MFGVKFTRFLLLLFGTTDMVGLLVGVIFVWIGQVISLIFHVTDRDPQSPRTPEDFEWGFWYKDNKKRIWRVMLVAFIGLRFSAYFKIIPNGIVNVADNDVVALTSFFLGLSLDRLALIIISYRKQQEKP